ncbi:FadR/GntR family transcriptional regulator [Spirochaeta thermophila]|uniref:Transcriptional regulatory protein n=1 Tax=Winmispira thermophila (strain ATCC 49972 / DSM 6192 / RI 19.B1) TaxID=665571 RepID=E0RR00_WINT6|nr:FadR/GntR family transcriptional regulator [Spirochaeta thermophila]ADN01578.1 transcriptional regulatory protein [Spirochaeta thermophila DSM 6192]
MYRRVNAKTHLSREIADHIKDLIRRKKLNPGEKLPNEIELAQLFGVSRPTIREAIKTLVSQNIIEIVRGKGTYVSRTPGLQEDPLGLEFLMDENLQLALIEVRLIVEPPVAKLAAERRTPEDIARIEEILARMEQEIRDGQIGLVPEMEFHRSLAEATRNPVIMRLVPLITDAIRKIYGEAPRTLEEHREALEEHRDILSHIREGHGEKAGQAMKHHLEKSYRRTQRKQWAKTIPHSFPSREETQ